MKDRLCACILEANAYSKVIGEHQFYKIHLKLEDEHTADISIANYLASVRYDQIFVEILNLRKIDNDRQHIRSTAKSISSSVLKQNSRDASRIMSAERFFEEHARIYVEIKKRRSLMPKCKASLERLQEKIILSNLSHQFSYQGILSLNGDIILEVEHKDSTDDTENETLGVGDTSLSKDVAHENLRKILLSCMKSAREVEDQVNEIKSRGWNLGVP
jgi:hypothetical protein